MKLIFHPVAQQIEERQLLELAFAIQNENYTKLWYLDLKKHGMASSDALNVSPLVRSRD